MIGNAKLLAKCIVWIDGQRRYFFFFDNKEIYWQDEGRKWHPFDGGWPYALTDCQDIRDEQKFAELFPEWLD